MNIQSMRVMVDSLSNERNNQYKKASDFNFTLPKATKDDDIITSDYNVEQDTTKVKTPFIATEVQQSKKKQIELLNISISDLKNYKAALENSFANILWRTKSINKYLVEIHKKFSIPFACLVFVLVGAPLGIMTKKGNFGVAAIISAVILTFYWIALIQGEKLADRLFISPFFGMWSFNIVLGLLGAYLTLKLTHGLKLEKLFSKNG